MLDLRRERERRGLSLEVASGRSRIPVRYLMALENGTAAQVGPMRDWRQRYITFLGLRDAEAIPTEDRPGPAVERSAEPAEEPSADPEPTNTTTTATIPRHEELPVGRLLLSGFVLTLLVMLFLKLGSLVIDMSSVNEPPPKAILVVSIDGAEAAGEAVGLVSTEVIASTSVPVPGGGDPGLAPEAAAGAATAEIAATTPPIAAKVALPKGVQQIRVRAVEPTRVDVTAGTEIKHKGLLEAGEAVDVESKDTVVIDAADLTQVVVHQNGARIEPLHNLSKGRRLVFLADGQD